MRIDKKSRGSRLRFIVLEQVGKPTILEGPDAALLIAAHAKLGQAEDHA
jgi:3-dehydroquinate synthase